MTYSQAARNAMTELDGEDTWLENRSLSDNQLDQVRERLNEQIRNTFSFKEQYNNRIIQALETQDGIQELVSYKLNTQLAKVQLSHAIALKFKYFDTQFFTSFTRNKQTTPAHQIQFEEMLTTATNNYKHINNITILN